MDLEEEVEYNLSDDEEPITAQKVLEKLETAWLNERFAPEILPHQTDMLDLMLGQIAHMEENIKKLDKNDFRSISHRMELERIRYVIASYLRCRLDKIETYTQHILKEEQLRSDDQKRLSNEEIQFATQYYQSIENHFHQIAVRHMPPNLQADDSATRIVKPNMMSHVFLKANISVPGVIVGENDEEVDLAVGSQHIMPYQLASDLVIKGSVDLF